MQHLYYVWAVLLILANGLAWCGTVLSLPGNWVIVGLTFLFAWLVDGPQGQGIGWTTVLLLIMLAAAGEIAEFVAGAAGAARQGASRRAVALALAGAVVGSIAGVVVGLPVPIVGPLVAAVLGGALGAFGGAYVGEHWKGRAHAHRVAAGKGAFFGRLWGTVAKLAVGLVMFLIAAFDALLLASGA